MCNSTKCNIDGGCPFADSEESEIIQNYGCLPTPHEIVNMAVNHGRKWACHSNPSKPCKGAMKYIKDNNIKVSYITNAPLVTEKDNWGLYID